MKQEEFIEAIQQVWLMKEKVDTLRDEMEKDIHDIFKENGITSMNISIHPDGFSLETNEIVVYDTLQKIMEHYSEFSLHIHRIPAAFQYRFIVKSQD